MIEDAHARIPGGPLFGSHANQPMESLVVHGLVSAKGDQVIERGHTAPEFIEEQAKKQRDGRSARAVRNDDENTLSIDRLRGKCLRNERADLILVEKTVGIAFANDH